MPSNNSGLVKLTGHSKVLLVTDAVNGKHGSSKLYEISKPGSQQLLGLSGLIFMSKLNVELSFICIVAPEDLFIVGIQIQSIGGSGIGDINVRLKPVGSVNEGIEQNEKPDGMISILNVIGSQPLGNSNGALCVIYLPQNIALVSNVILIINL